MKTESTEAIDIRQLNRVIAIMAYGRAGSGLWASLLDGHPNLLSTPDCLLMDFYDFWAKNGHLPACELISSFMDHYAVLFDARQKCKCHGHDRHCGDYLGLTRMGPNRDEYLYADREVFTRRITEILGDEHQVPRRLFFQALHLVYSEALGRRVTDPRIVFGLHIGDFFKVQRCVDDFPDTLFLQTVRHPILGLGSWFRHYHLAGELTPNHAFIGMRMAFYGGVFYGQEQSPEFRRRWCAVKLEDLHQNPSQTIQKVCDWLNLPWDDSLLQSTFNSKQWWNEKNTKRVSGFSNAIPSQKFESYISTFDRFRFNVLFAPKCEFWRYSMHPWYRTTFARLLVLPLLLIPFKMELLSLASLKEFYKYSNRPIVKRMGGAIYRGCYAIYRCRRSLLGMWLHLFRGERNEIPLLENDKVKNA